MSHPLLPMSLKFGLLSALLLGGGSAQAQSDDGVIATDQPAAVAQSTGKIVQIGPADDSNLVIAEDAVEETGADPNQPLAPPAAKYWLGMLAEPVPELLRAQIEIPAGQGVLVRHVVPGSPAEKAGLKVFDIVLTANDTPLADLRDLLPLVTSEGERSGTIKVDVLRRGAHQTLTLTPAARPEQLANQAWGLGGPALGRNPLMQPFDHSGQPLQSRLFGPGSTFAQGGLNLSQMPNGVSVSIQKQDNEPPHITVRRGNDSWNIVGDDPNSLAQLPDDVRPFVERMLAGNSLRAPFTTMPAMPNFPRHGGFDDDMMQQQLQQIEQQLQQMRLRMQQQADQLRRPPSVLQQPQEDAQSAPGDDDAN